MIRKARASDLPLLADIERSASTRFLGTHLAWAAEGTLPAAKLKTAQEAGLLWVVADSDDQPIGFACTHRTADGLYIEELDIARPHQSKGLGRTLLDVVVAAARQMHLPAVTLTTDRTLAWNAPFYARYGFKLLGDAELTPALKAQIDLEVSHGHDRARRCGMILPL